MKINNSWINARYKNDNLRRKRYRDVLEEICIAIRVSKSILFDNETEWIWVTNPKVQQQTGFIERKVAIEIRERYLWSIFDNWIIEMVELDEEREKFEVVCIRMSARLQGTDCVDLVPQTIVQCRGCWKGVCSFTWHQGRCIDDRIWTILPRILVFTRFPPPFLSFKSISINIIFSLTIFPPTQFF